MIWEIMSKQSCGGLTTKIHAMVDANGMPVALKLSAGQAYDGYSAFEMLGSLGPGNVLLADRAYYADNLHAAIDAKGAWPDIPSIRSADINPSSARSSINTAMQSRKLAHCDPPDQWLLSSANSNTSKPSLHDTTNAMITSSLPYNSHQSEYGCVIIQSVA